MQLHPPSRRAELQVQRKARLAPVMAQQQEQLQRREPPEREEAVEEKTT